MKLLFAFLLISTTALCQKPDSSKLKSPDSVTIKLDVRAQALLKRKGELAMQQLQAAFKQAEEKIQAEYNSSITTIIELQGHDIDKIKWESFRYVNAKFTYVEKE